jgi:hypothetical protein
MRERAVRLCKEAIRRVLADEATARRWGRALSALQRGKERFDRAGEAALGTLGIAGRDEWRRLARRLAGTKRRLREAGDRLSRVEATPAIDAKSRRSVVDR